MRRHAWILIVLLSVGCAPARPIHDPRAPVPRPTAKPKEDEEVRARRARLTRCLDQLPTAPEMNAHPLAGLWSCVADGALYQQAACREALAAARPGQVNLVVQRCKEAYCPRLKEQPSICHMRLSLFKRPESGSFLQVARRDMQRWFELHLAILELELGRDRTLLARLMTELTRSTLFEQRPLKMPLKMKIELPRTARSAPVSDVIVSIDARGRVEIMGVSVPAGGLKARLTRIYSRRPGSRILISADPQVPHQTVVKVMDAAKAVGFKRLGIAVQSKP